MRRIYSFGFNTIFLVLALHPLVKTGSAKSPCASSPGGCSAHLNLAEAKNFAVMHNREVLALRHAAAEAKARAERALAPFFPAFGVTLGGQAQVTPQQNTLEPLGYFYLSYNLFNGYHDSYQHKIAVLEAEKAEIELKHKEHLAGLEVEKYFHDFLFSKAATELKKEAITVNTKLKNAASRRKAAGLGSDADSLEFSLRESILQAELVLLEQKTEEARIGLRKTLGEEIGSQIEPIGKLLHQHLDGDLMSELESLKKANPLLRASARELAIADFQAQSWRSRWLPKIDFEARAGYLENEATVNTFREKQSSGTFLLVAKLELFSGRDAAWQKVEGAAHKLKAEEELKAKLVNLVSEVERLFRRIKAIEQSVDLEALNELRARTYYETVLREYHAGIKNSSDVKAAADLLAETSLRWLRYKYDFLCERIELEKILGVPVATQIIAETPAVSKKEDQT